MLRVSALLLLLGAVASLTAQVPMAVSVPHAQDCDVAATATPASRRRGVVCAAISRVIFGLIGL